MIWKSILLCLALLLNQDNLVLVREQVFEKKTPQEKSVDQIADIKCTITADKVHWHVKDKNVVISMEIEVRGTIRSSVMPAVQLTALPKIGGLEQQEYWAPFSVATGKSTSDWQKLDFAAENAHSVRLVLSELRWAPTKSSVWPSEAMKEVVPPGEYSLQVCLEVNKGKTFVSNEVQITILK